jgi:hypothetical protein
MSFNYVPHLNFSGHKNVHVESGSERKEVSTDGFGSLHRTHYKKNDLSLA